MATESELRTKTSTFLNSYKGCAEGGTLHKKLIDMFNNSGLCTRYKVTYKDAWCAVAVSDCFIGTDLTSIFPCVECGCANMISKAQSAGIWVENDAYTPKVGDVVLYDWQDSGSGDNTGTPDHVGIVQSVGSTSFVVIEGNKSDTVGTRTMSINGRYIRGFITPNYAKAASSGTTGGTGGTTKSGTGGTTGTTSSSSKLSVDGQIGNKTVTKLQKVMGQTGSNVDGFIDGQPSGQKKYWTSILTEACRWTGGSSAVVKKLQQYIKDAGYSPGTVDGKLGTKTAKALQQYLIAKGHSCGSTGADGYFGTNSAKALQNWLNTK